MAQNYDFLRSFTIGGKDTKHLFQIAKLNIPFLSKENEFFQVGNTDGKKFRNTRLGEYTLSIDGFIIKDNTGKTVPQVMDELKALVNSDEPQKLVFDIFPDRYFNAIFTGAEEYDATDLKYTPLTLTFDVPDGMAHAIEPIGFSNTYSTTTNVMLDSEYNAINKYMKPWVQKLDEKFNNSNVVQGDFTNGIPLNFERDKKSDERWLNYNPATTIHVDELKVGDEVNFSVYAQVVSIDEENNKDYAGQVILEEWDTVKGAILKRHIVYIPKKVTTEFTEYGSVVKIENEKTNAVNLQYGFRGSNLIKWSKPMVSFLPPIGETVTAPSVGAKAYSNSLDFGEYDYSGNKNLFSKPFVASNITGAGNGSFVTQVGDSVRIEKSSDILDIGKTYEIFIGNLLNNTQYTLSYDVLLESGSTGILNGCNIALEGKYGDKHEYIGVFQLHNITTTDVYQKVTSTFTSSANMEKYDKFKFRVYVATGVSLVLKIKNVKIERGSTATPYQPNLLDDPYWLGKTPLGENLVTNGKFPIITTTNPISGFDISEELIIGETYTVSLKGTKPVNKEFQLYYGDAGNYQATLLPVEGLTDVWSSTFTARNTTETSNLLRVDLWQKPNSVPDGAVQIDWLKIEKGDTRTPNIPYYKYEGIAPAPSNNPKDYHWGYSPSYINAVEYVASGDSVGDLVKIENNGTYRTKPRFSFRMKGENGLVGLIHQNGSVLQFGNPEDVDGTTPTRQEFGLRENLYGSTLNSNIKVNKDFKSVYPNMNSNPSTPNLFQGSWNMTDDIDSATPQFATAPAQEVWHGPSMVLPIQAPSDNNRAGHFRTHVRFNFDNRSKRARGRTEVSVMDTSGKYVMGAVIRDSDNTSDSFVFEAWYKGTMVKSQTITKTVFNKAFFELVLYRTGKELLWKLTQIKSLNANNTVNDDRVIWVSWNLDEPETSLINTVGVWQMRHQNNQHVLMSVTDVQARWYGTRYYQDIKNQFQDGDIVEVDVASRALFINGSVNNTLNVVGNEWETFVCEPGETIIQPIVSEWANMPEVTAEIRQNYL